MADVLTLLLLASLNPATRTGKRAEQTLTALSAQRFIGILGAIAKIPATQTSISICLKAYQR